MALGPRDRPHVHGRQRSITARRRRIAQTLARIRTALRPETIVVGSGIAKAPIVTVPGVLVKGTAEVSAPVEKLKSSKKVDGLELIEPLPEGGTRLTVYESPTLVIAALRL